METEDHQADGGSGQGFKLFVGQIPKDLNEEGIKQYFTEFGPVKEFSIMRDNNFISKGCAFVSFYSEAAALAAIEAYHDKKKLPNAQNFLQVRMAVTPGASDSSEKDIKVFVGMLAKSTTEEDLEVMFGVYGDLKEVHVIRGPDGAPKGCAFIKYFEKNAAYTAIEQLHDTIPSGSFRNLVVKLAEAKGGGKASSSPKNGNGQSLSRQGGTQSSYPAAGKNPIHWQYPNTAPPPHGPSPPHQSPHNPSYPMHHPSYPSNFIRYPPLMEVNQIPSTTMPYMPLPPENSLQPFSVGMYSGMNQQHSSTFPSPSSLQTKNEPVGYEQAGPAAQLQTFRSETPVGVFPGPPSHVSSPRSDGEFPASKYGGNKAGPFRPPQGPRGANLFVYHLPKEVTDSDLATLFAPFGNVISAKVFVDKKTSESKGFGFVSYDSAQSAIWAIEYMNGFHIGNKRLQVEHKWV